MEQAEHDFGRALSVDAEAIGPAGQRRFRLMVRSTSRSAAVWMEKQQLAGIGTWMAEMCGRLDREKPNAEPDVEPLPFGAIFEVDLRAGQIGLGYVEDQDLFAIQAFDAERGGAQRRPAFRCFLSRGQCRVLSRKIETVVSAGRPICPLCAMPIDPNGHVCPRANGHSAPISV
jgi:uncharacterized repeat protein (TIGR03847 family)